MHEPPAPSGVLTVARHGEAPRSLVVHAPGVSIALPAIVALAGDRAAQTTFEFFTASIANDHTRRAYGRAVAAFCSWCEAQGLTLGILNPPVIAAYYRELAARGNSVATQKLVASSLRHWLDALTVAGVLPHNPALSVRTPRLAVRQGKTPVFESKDDARRIFESLSGGSLLELRDRALLAIMLYPPFARVSAVVGMNRRDFEDSALPYLVLHEKGGVERREACHHKTAEYLRAYLELAGDLVPGAPLFQSAPKRSGKLSGVRLAQGDAWSMVKRRCKALGLPSALTCHSFRATGITLHREAGADIRATQRLAGHASLDTTAGYDHSTRKEDRAEVERVQL